MRYVQRLHRQGEQITLLPENESYEPIPVEAHDDFHILGRVVGAFRQL